MLKPVPLRKDLFKKPTPDHPPAVNNKRNNNNRAYYTVMWIVGRQARRYGRAKDKTIRYAVIWKGYENQPARWVNRKDINKDLVEEYDQKHGPFNNS